MTTNGETAKRRNGETAKRRNGETAKRRNGETAKHEGGQERRAKSKKGDGNTWTGTPVHEVEVAEFELRIGHDKINSGHYSPISARSARGKMLLSHSFLQLLRRVIRGADSFDANKMN